MKMFQILGLGMILTLLVSTGCSKPALENQSAADQTPPAISQTTSNESTADADSASNGTMGQAIGASDATDRDMEMQASVYFDFDSARLNNSTQADLSQKAKWLRDNPQVASVLIEGHCDERGTDAYNMALGDRRANAVKDYLIDLGVVIDKLETQSYGEEKPADQGQTEAAWAKNRRADFVVH